MNHVVTQHHMTDYRFLIAYSILRNYSLANKFDISEMTVTGAICFVRDIKLQCVKAEHMSLLKVVESYLEDMERMEIIVTTTTVLRNMIDSFKSGIND